MGYPAYWGNAKPQRATREMDSRYACRISTAETEKPVEKEKPAPRRPSGLRQSTSAVVPSSEGEVPRTVSRCEKNPSGRRLWSKDSQKEGRGASTRRQKQANQNNAKQGKVRLGCWIYLLSNDEPRWKPPLPEGFLFGSTFTTSGTVAGHIIPDHFFPGVLGLH
jgi:hypothetical protein